jgi:hypothetical protein
MPEKMNDRVQQKIISLWSGTPKEKELISYKQIVITLKRDGVSERTVARRLLALVRENKLEKIEQGYKKTFYRPNKEFWENIVHSKQQFLVSEESLRRIGTYVMNTLSVTIADTEKTSKQIESQLWEKISSLVPKDEPADTSDAFTKAMDLVLKEKSLTEEERKELFVLSDSLIRGSILQALTNPIVFARLRTGEDLANIVEEDVWKLVKTFMAIWVFLYKHPNAVTELEEHLQRIIT